MSSTRPIAIVGAGPGGLMLGCLLQSQGFDVSIFEADGHAGARRQGGSLDLHADSGLLAIDEAGLRREFDALARYEDQCDSFYDQEGNLLLTRDFSEAIRPEIDRGQLRDLLLAKLAPGTVRWNIKIQGVASAAEGHRLMSDEGDVGRFGLVVGADGAWSRVRKLITPRTPQPTGLVYYEWDIENIDVLHPALATLLPRGKIGAVAIDRGLIAQRSSGGQIKVYLLIRDDAGEIGRLNRDTRVDVSELLHHLDGWSESLRAFALAANGFAQFRSLCVLPGGTTWPSIAGITLLGDAAHVMAPFGGEGVNMALEDARQLARCLVQNSDWNAATADYEHAMLARVKDVAERCNAAAFTWPKQTFAMIEKMKAQPSAVT